MEHQIKAIVAAITHEHTKSLIITHLKGLKFENKHLTLFLDNVAPLHELSAKGLDEHLRKGLEKVYGEDITYELKPFHHHVTSDRDKGVAHEIRKPF